MARMDFQMLRGLCPPQSQLPTETGDGSQHPSSYLISPIVSNFYKQITV